ncbi:MAG: TonB-dependent receptor [Alistipes sp.]|nr:TonB-dependent receptor [Alistipes sp.]
MPKEPRPTTDSPARPATDPPETPETPRHRLVGRITHTDGSPMPGAVITVTEPADGPDGRYLKGCLSDVYGIYTMVLEERDYLLNAFYMGFESVSVELKIRADTTVDFVLAESSTELDDIVISARGGRLRSATMGMENLTPEFIRTMPALMGEADLMKSLQLLPGVQATSEGGSGFSVRGGGHDQNLILLDDATLYNASHLMGFFSVFNNDVVDDVTLYKGDIPASFGGRLSSLLDVRTRDGGRERIAGSGGIGLISSRISLEGPLGHDDAGFLVSGRRTYADLFLKLMPDEDLRKSKLYFYDANLRLAYDPGPRDRLYLSGYLGRDKMGTSFLGMDFGNRALSLKWSHTFSPNVYSSLSLTGSGYDYRVTAEYGDDIDQYWKSAMNDYGVRAETVFRIAGEHTLRAGWNMVYHLFRPGDMASRSADPMLAEIKLPRQDAMENGLYLSAESPVGGRLRLKYGVRTSFFSNIASGGSRGAGNADGSYSGGRYGRRFNLEPRVGMVWHAGESASVKASYSRTVQYIHIASNSAAGSPLDVWFQSSPGVKP